MQAHTGGRKALTKQLGPISTRHSHELLLTAWVIWEVWCDIIHLPIDHRPSILFLVVQLKHGWWDTN